MRCVRVIGSVLSLLIVPGSLAAGENERPGARVVAFSPDGQRLAAGTGLREQEGLLTVWDLGTYKPRWIHREIKGIAGAAFSPDGKTLAIGYFAPSAKLLRVSDGAVVAEFGGHTKEVRAVAFSPDGKTLATGSYDRTIKIWDVVRATERATLTGHTDMIFSVAFAPDGKRLVSAGSDGARLWDLATGKELRHWTHGSFITHCAVFLPDNRSVLTGGWDGSIRLWDVSTGEMRIKWKNLGGVDGLAFAPATRTLAVCGYSKEVNLFEFTLDEPSPKDRDKIQALLAKLDEESYETREAAGRELLAIGFIAEPELRRSMNSSPSVEVRIRTRRLRAEMLQEPRVVLKGHRDGIEGVALSPDGRLLASASKDGTVRLWDVTNRKEVKILVPGE
jgi:WD40 repeat protein